MLNSFSHDTFFVDLPAEPETQAELESVNEALATQTQHNLVIDFSKVDIVTSSSLSKLLKLRKLLIDSGHRLILCGLGCSTKGIFRVTALDQVFEFADNKASVLNTLSLMN
jgi:anti-anti-sigma factor